MKATPFWLPIAVPATVTRSSIVRGTGAPRPLMGAYSAPIPPSLIDCVTVETHDSLTVHDLGGRIHSPVLHAQADTLGLALSHQYHPSPCPGRPSRPRWDGGTLGL